MKSTFPTQGELTTTAPNPARVLSAAVPRTACLVLWGLLAVAGCSSNPDDSNDSSDVVRAVGSIVPVRTFIERVGGDRVQAHALVPPGMSPHSYEPTAKQMVQLAEADVFFRVGAPFEETLLPRLRKTIPGLKIVDLRRGLDLIEMPDTHDHDAHDHDDHDAHDHGHDHAVDPHVWMDPLAVRTMAETIAVTLSELDTTADGSVYRNNLDAFQHELDAVHSQLAKTLGPYRGRTLLVFHPAFGYFCRRYDLKQQAIEVEGKQPSAKQLAGIIDQARKLDVRVIFVQPQFPEDSARRLASALDAAVVPMDPLAADYLANLRRMGQAVASALSRPAPSPQP